MSTDDENRRSASPAKGGQYDADLVAVEGQTLLVAHHPSEPTQDGESEPVAEKEQGR